MRIPGNMPLNLGNLTTPGDIGGLTGIRNGAQTPPQAAPVSGQGSFAETIKSTVEQVNAIQANADTMAQKLATGDVEDIHQVLMALDHASNAFGVTVQVRNKVVEAYQEIMRMQV